MKDRTPIGVDLGFFVLGLVGPTPGCTHAFLRCAGQPCVHMVIAEVVTPCGTAITRLSLTPAAPPSAAATVTVMSEALTPDRVAATAVATEVLCCGEKSVAGPAAVRSMLTVGAM